MAAHACYQCTKKEPTDRGEKVYHQGCNCKDAMAYVHDICLAHNVIELVVMHGKQFHTAYKCSMCNRPRRHSKTLAGRTIEQQTLLNVTFFKGYATLQSIATVLPVLVALWLYGFRDAIYVAFPIIFLRGCAERFVLYRFFEPEGHPSRYTCFWDISHYLVCYMFQVTHMLMAWRSVHEVYAQHQLGSIGLSRIWTLHQYYLVLSFAFAFCSLRVSLRYIRRCLRS